MSIRKMIAGVVITPALAVGSYYGYQAFTPDYMYEYVVTIEGQEYSFDTAEKAEEYKVTHELNNIQEIDLTKVHWENGTYDKNINDEANNYNKSLSNWLTANPHKTRGGVLASSNPETQELGSMGEILANNFAAKDEDGIFTNTLLRSVFDEANTINDLLFVNSVNLFELDTKEKLDYYVELMIKGAGIDANLNATELTLWCGPAQWGPITVNMLTPESLYKFEAVFSSVFNQLFGKTNRSRTIDLEKIFNMTECTPNTIASNPVGTPIVNIDDVVTYVQSLYVESDFDRYEFNVEADYKTSSEFSTDFSKWKTLHNRLYNYQTNIYKVYDEVVDVATQYAKETHVVVERRK